MAYAEPTLEELNAEEAELKGRLDWVARKKDGIAVEALLSLVPTGSRFDTRGDVRVPREYSALYLKNADGTWNQVKGTTGAPHVINMSANHLGFVTRYQPIADAVEKERVAFAAFQNGPRYA